jgi:hypothetical protein
MEVFDWEERHHQTPFYVHTVGTSPPTKLDLLRESASTFQ